MRRRFESCRGRCVTAAHPRCVHQCDFSVGCVVESAAMRQYMARMKKPWAQALYKKRCEIAEFPHMWAKAVKKWRRFSVRGLVKTGMEALWVAFATSLIAYT